MEETIGERIERLRTAKGWSRPQLGKEMGRAIGREPFSGELIRLYETGANEPGNDARAALAKVFDKTEAYIEFGVLTGAQTHKKVESTDAEKLLAIVRTFLDIDGEGRKEIGEAVHAIAKAHGASRASASRRAKRR
jgi:transcriptional regulator with XRE-family HTH domain